MLIDRDSSFLREEVKDGELDANNAVVIKI